MRCRTSEVAFAIALGGLQFSKSINLNLIGALFALTATTGAMAAEAIIGGVSINLPPPASFCELSARNPSDNKVLTSTGELLGKAGNKLLGMSADCQQLADWRANRRSFLDDYGEYQTPSGAMDQLVASPEATIRQTCADLRTQGAQIASDQTPGMKSAFENTLKNIRLNETKFVGVFAEDQAACYAGLITKIQTDKGTEKTQIVLFAVTVVQNKIILIYRFAVYTDSGTATTLLTKLKGTVAALYAANK